MKMIDYQERVLSLEEAFRDVPEPETSIGELYQVADTGDCWQKLILHTNTAEFRNYLDTIEKTDWQPLYVSREPIVKILYSAMYVKKDRFLTVAYYNFDGSFLPPKMYIVVGLLPSYFLEDKDILFKEVPPVREEEEPIPFTDQGGGYYMQTVQDAELSEMEDYVRKATDAGFRVMQDQTSVIANSVYACNLQKDSVSLTVSYLSPMRKMLIVVGRGEQSPYLKAPIHPEKAFLPGLKTSVHLLEMWNFGNSFVIRLKNGHFLINDGGTRLETPYLLDYLDSLVPEGETPVVEGWFLSHPHGDHTGVIVELAINPAWKDRVIVNGIYYAEPSLEILRVDAAAIGLNALIRRASRHLRTQDGKPTPFYRPHLGDRYYFSDVVVDAIMNTDLAEFQRFSGDLNDTTTWLMITIEGQKVLLGGDGDKSGRNNIMNLYHSDYMIVDVMSVLHHGFNTDNAFTNYCHAKTVLFTCFGDGPRIRKNQNTYLRSCSEESYSWGDGTVMLEFPYKVGEAVRKPHFDFEKYNAGEERPEQPNAQEKRR